MLNNQSIPAPSNSGPIEMVSPPIDWAAYVPSFQTGLDVSQVIEIPSSLEVGYLVFLFGYFFTLFIIKHGMELWYDD